MPLQDIKELNLDELRSIIQNWGWPKFHADQIFNWAYQKNILDFLKMNNLPADLRARLSEKFTFLSISLQESVISRDGTQKFLFRLPDDNLIEAVLIPEKTRVTACLSTQVGCKFACKFCASGLSGFKRNLEYVEILDQVLYLKDYSADKKLTHIVFMGIGEPLDNYDNLLKAVRIINSAQAFNIGSRRITISTCGLVPGIRRLMKEGLQVELSISLHATDDKTRNYLMPINKKYPLKELISACKDYIKVTNRLITLEYALIKGVNSDLQSAQNLATIVEVLGLCKINLIPVNPIERLHMEPPGKLDILLFKNILVKLGVMVTLRRPRGKDIEAACGQLRLKFVDTFDGAKPHLSRRGSKAPLSINPEPFDRLRANGEFIEPEQTPG